jgi:signal transduction histidine kinase
MPRTKRILVSKTALALGTWAAYVLAFIPLYHLVGSAAPVLAILPVVAMGWLFGMRAGLLASLLSFPLNVLLTTLVGEAGWDVMIRGGLPGSVLLVLIGIVVGRLHDLGERVKRELAERERAEEALRRAHDELEMRVQERTAELARANEELRRFTYVASHHLRGPLVNLKGFTAELRAALAVIGSSTITALPHLDEKQQQAVLTALQENIPEALGFIDSSVTRMDFLVNALLKLSRLGLRELKFKPIDMNALVQTTLQTLAHQVRERQVNMTVDPLPEVVADQSSMEQIMGNLLINAMLYLDPDRPGEIDITAKSGPDETAFSIRDNGRGIAEEDMDKVFAPFRRAGKQDVPGEGMGLGYVQTLVRRHGGRIWCESELGVETMFTFTISNHLVKGDSHV